MILLVLMFEWQSEGINITNLNRETIDYRNYLYIYLGIAFLTIFYSIAMTIVGFAKLQVPATMVNDKCVLFFSFMHYKFNHSWPL